MAPEPPPTLPSAFTQLASLYNTYVLPHLPDPLQSLSTNLSPFLSSLALAASNGDFISIAAFLLTIYLGIKIADAIRRSVIGWVVFAIKIAFILAAVNAVFYINRYGWQQALGDAEWMLGILWSLVEDRVAGGGDGKDNRTGWYSGGGGSGGGATGGGYGARDHAWSGAYGGGRQQVPVGGQRKSAGRRGGWT